MARKPVKKAVEKPTRNTTQPRKPIREPMWKSKYRHLLDDPNVMRWFMNECRGSEITGRERLRRLGVICQRFDKTEGLKGQRVTVLMDRIREKLGEASKADALTEAS